MLYFFKAMVLALVAISPLAVLAQDSKYFQKPDFRGWYRKFPANGQCKPTDDMVRVLGEIRSMDVPESVQPGCKGQWLTQMNAPGMADLKMPGYTWHKATKSIQCQKWGKKVRDLGLDDIEGEE
ncbi:hypothetical protein AJ80_02916 [Polytolypa hystricis UAMH7299]|uniref:Uncharacterized protein n=1 Tax=Polytolypa hystricis (strain UAMH7299) TaxID=1447883 RepID=A0A2B7YPL7_POLH7|nr:hypothetical protein AJ80_02916 [Polytolypa hystricis UAMH7299]